jgi:hypothetical protein
MTKKTAKRTVTPGPWKWYWTVAADDETVTDCGVYSEHIFGQAVSVCRAPRYESKEQWEANAGLISSAPDLLEALEMMVDMWNSGDSTKLSKRAQKRRSDMWDKVNAAIRNAKGEL